MSHVMNLVDDVLTIRITGRAASQEVLQDLGKHLNGRHAPVTVILDLTMASQIDQNLKAALFRAFQHRAVDQIGIASGNPDMAVSVTDLETALQRVRKVQVGKTEMDVLAKFGLAEPPTQPRKLTGMLSFLKNNPPTQQQ